MPDVRKPRPVVYLLHFDEPYRHARHYLGATVTTAARRAMRHRLYPDARLLQVVRAAGIGFTVARVWARPSKAQAFRLERQLKQRSSTRYCPLCRLERAFSSPGAA